MYSQFLMHGQKNIKLHFISSYADWSRCKSWENYLFMFREYNAGQNHNIKIGNKSFERLEEFTYLETTIKYQNSIHETMKNRLNSGKACLYSVQNFLPS